MSIPKDTRQIMINLMYLVLTALLALNVSAEILNAFHVVNRGISNSNIAVDKKTAETMNRFMKELEVQQEKAKPFYDKADETKKLTDAFIVELDKYKTDIIKGSSGWVENETGIHYTKNSKEWKDWSHEKGELDDDRNLDASTRIMIDGGGGEEVKKKIEELRSKFLSMVENPEAKKLIDEQLPLRIEEPKKNEEGKQSDWVDANFHMVPTIAALTLLNKFQNDARNSEAQIMDYLFAQINAKDTKFDQMAAKVIAPTSYIMQGTEYKADILVAAYNSAADPQVLIGSLNSNAVKDEAGNFMAATENPVTNGTPIEVIGGIGRYKVSGGGEGIRPYSGAVMILGPDGTPTYYPFEAEYMVAKGAAVVSSDNLNIIYAGIPNPFSVSVPGFPADRVNASASAGSFTKKGAGKFEANMASSLINQKIKINVSVQLDEGGSRVIGSPEFVVKRIPDPIAKVGGSSGGRVKTGELKAAPGIGAVLQDFYFQGVRFDVTSFECVYIPKRQDAKIVQNGGAKWNSQVQSFITACKPGDQIIFRDIKAKGPDGTTRSLNSIPLEIQ